MKVAFKSNDPTEIKRFEARKCTIHIVRHFNELLCNKHYLIWKNQKRLIVL